ncbi:hypothetical protein HYS47_03385 [Candidatus Woesearchaeota archaeon]|nr:hypothetical protein [Candidatus Woesearchaeota archaeon]
MTVSDNVKNLISVFVVIAVLVSIVSFTDRESGLHGKAVAITGNAVVCGDGVVATGEACDDGNADDYDGCSSSCDVVRKRTCLTMPGGHVEGVALHYSLGFEGLCGMGHPNTDATTDQNSDGRLDYNDQCFYKDYQNECSADGTLQYYYECSPSNLPIKRSRECPGGCVEGICA